MSEMKLKLVVIFLSISVVYLEASTEYEGRTEKWFWPRTKIKYIQQKSVVTQTFPSSCVVVDPSLPPCRYARKIPIEPTSTEKIKMTTAPDSVDTSITVVSEEGMPSEARFLFSSESVPNEWRTPENETKPLSWAEYFGLGYVTVTKTVVHSVTAKYHDPKTVFSYNVKGCRPTVLPFNLPLCNNNTTSHPINSFSKEVHYAP